MKTISGNTGKNTCIKQDRGKDPRLWSQTTHIQIPVL